MKTTAHKLRKSRGVLVEIGGQGNMASNIIPDLLRKQSHASIDINQPPKIEDNSEVNSLFNDSFCI